MPRKALASRDKWQDGSLKAGRSAESAFKCAIFDHLLGGPYDMQCQPNDLSGIYGQRLVRGNWQPHGMRPEMVIRHRYTNKAVFVEVKRQQDSGNAHERACRYFMPGVLESARAVAHQGDDTVPFWIIFADDIARDTYYCQEINHWFRGYEAHVLLWPDPTDDSPVRDHFDAHISGLLEA